MVEENKTQTLQKRLSLFDKIEEANNRALNSMGGVKRHFEEGDYKEVWRNYNLLLNHMFDMVWSYGDLGSNHLYCLYTLSKLEESTGDFLEDAQTKILDGIDVNNSLDKVLIDLSREFHGSSEMMKEIDIGCSCETLHELIRYLHRMTIAHVFSGVGLSEKQKITQYKKEVTDNKGNKSNIDGSKLCVIRADKGKNSDLLEAMGDIYEKKADGQGTENYDIIITDKRLIARAEMGCHFSGIDCEFTDEEARLSVNFQNTSEKTFSNAPYRAEYVRKVLEGMHFQDVRTEGLATTGRMSGIKREDLPDMLTKVTRMFASTKDLDTKGSYSEHVDESVKLFFDGTTNIYDYLKKKYGEDGEE